MHAGVSQTAIMIPRPVDVIENNESRSAQRPRRWKRTGCYSLNVIDDRKVNFALPWVPAVRLK
jgi:hypothetical protein